MELSFGWATIHSTGLNGGREIEIISEQKSWIDLLRYLHREAVGAEAEAKWKCSLLRKIRSFEKGTRKSHIAEINDLL